MGMQWQAVVVTVSTFTDLESKHARSQEEQVYVPQYKSSASADEPELKFKPPTPIAVSSPTYHYNCANVR